MREYLNKEKFVLIYITVITALYPIFLSPDKVGDLFSLGRYSSVIIHYLSVFIFFFFVPSLIIKFYFHENLSGYGLNFKNFKKTLILLLILIPVVFVMIWFSVKDEMIIKEYPLVKFMPYGAEGGAFGNLGFFLIMEAAYLLYYIGWEFLFRGFIMLGMESKKKYSLMVPLVIQTIASTLLHYNKPSMEIILALVAGFFLGYYVYKYKTIWFAVVLHFLAGIMMDVFVLIRN